MQIRVCEIGILNNGENELSPNGIEFREKYPKFDINFEFGELYIQHREFKDKYGSASKIIEDNNSIVYDLMDSDYEANLNIINQMEEEIRELEKFIEVN